MSSFLRYRGLNHSRGGQKKDNVIQNHVYETDSPRVGIISDPLSIIKTPWMYPYHIP